MTGRTGRAEIDRTVRNQTPAASPPVFQAASIGPFFGFVGFLGSVRVPSHARSIAIGVTRAAVGAAGRDPAKWFVTHEFRMCARFP
jgi:hypothetical protein